MNDLMDFLTTSEAMIVYIVIGISCLLCLIIYIIDKSTVKRRQRHNTKELNKLVEKVREEVHEDDRVTYERPVLEVIPEKEEEGSVAEMLAYTFPLYEKPMDFEEEPVILEKPEIISSEPVENKNPLPTTSPAIIEKEEVREESSLEYTSIEPNKEEASEEIHKIAQELKQQENIQNEALTRYEEQQEENAIISMDELLKKSKAMYEANELTQYADEGNVPISLGELEEKTGREVTPYEDTFILENIVKEEEMTPLEEKPSIPEEDKKFKSSPIISPVYGIPKNTKDMQFENTANYDKFDAEIQKTNEFLMTLKELQENIE